MNCSRFNVFGSLFLFLLCTSSQLMSNPENVFSRQDLVGMGIRLHQNNRFAFLPMNNGCVRVFLVEKICEDGLKLEFSHEIQRRNGSNITLYWGRK